MSERLTIAGLATVGLSVVAVIALIATLLYPGVVAALATIAIAATCLTLWLILPLRRRAHRGSR